MATAWSSPPRPPGRASWSALGFEEDLVDLAPPAAREEQDAGQFWKDFIRDTAPEYRKSTQVQLETVTKPIWDALIDGVKYCEPQLKAIIERVQPDVIVEDNVITFPALLTAGKPFVRIVSCNPLEVRGRRTWRRSSPGCPPTTARSGTPSAPSTTAPTVRSGRPSTSGSSRRAPPPLPDLDFIHEGDLNLYVFPEIADYTDARPLGPAPGTAWTPRSARPTAASSSPRRWPAEDGALVYFSLGSLGSADVYLMRRVIDVLGTTPHRYIVSKGPLHEEIELADNMWGAEFVPQTKIIPLVDLVITHGGNNTTTEALHFGKPMILLPLFWDQYDNAQRVHELGYGVRLSTYEFTDAELTGALERLLGDTGLPRAPGRRRRGDPPA